MQRCGLAFVDANNAWEGETDKPEEADGILTANEVALLDLSHTRLAVLSACQTAVGDFSTEGVYGMHRGFKQAGVKSILATLWNVNDKSTARLMELFYGKWLSGTPMQQSLHEAVRELRKEYPSPFYWAPFVLMDADN
jgi:CHAT domain-containing protein